MHDLLNASCLVTVAGSQAYGMATETSDIDIRGVAFSTKESYLGLLDMFEQYDSVESMKVFMPILTEKEKDIAVKQKLEGSIYEIKKFIGLAMNSNPNILDCLFCDDAHVRRCNWAGEILRSNRELFITTKAKFSYAGYAAQQIRRLKNHKRWIERPVDKPTRAQFDLPDIPLMDEKNISAAEAALAKKINSWNLDLSFVRSDGERIAIQEQYREHIEEILGGDKLWKRAGRMIGYDENMLVILEKERQYATAVGEYKAFLEQQKTRNESRAALEMKFGFDTKHASQCIRLLRTCKELLTDGKINVNRKNIDAEELLDIKHGRWSFEKLMQENEKLMAEIEILHKSNPKNIKTKLDKEKIHNLCVEIMGRYLSS